MSTTSEAIKTPEADSFPDNFEPDQWLDYGWVLERAKAYYNEIDDSLNSHSVNACEIVNQCWYGIAAVVLITVFGVSLNVLSVYTAAAVIPSIVFAVAAIVYASRVGCSIEVYAGPSAKNCVDYINHYKSRGTLDTASKRAEYATIGIWERARMDNTEINDKVADTVQTAEKMKAISAGLLLLPVIVAIAVKFVDQVK